MTIPKDLFYLSVVVVCLLLAVGICGYFYRFQNEKDLPLIGDRRLISVLQYEQKSQHTVVGSVVEPFFEFIDTQNGIDVKFISPSLNDYQLDDNDMHGKDGSVAFCDDKYCSIIDSNHCCPV